MINNLRKIREEKKMTQKELCDKCGISTIQDFFRVESKNQAPRVDKALRIAKALGVSVNDIWKLN